MYNALLRLRLLLVCAQGTVQIGKMFVVCTVISAEWDCFWCVYSAQWSVRLLLVCAEFTVQIETVIGVCTVQSAERDCFWCVHIAQCRVRLLLVYAQCTTQSETAVGMCRKQSETVIGVCTVYSKEWDFYGCLYKIKCRVRVLFVCLCAQCRVRLLLVFIQWTVQSETAYGVCTVHNKERDFHCCVYNLQCSLYSLLFRMRLLLVC